MTALKISKADLTAPDLPAIIRDAYRRQAKIHHPDLGGDAETFRKIHEAYLDLVHWSRNPTFAKRRGFPDKWFYDGSRCKWVQPVP